MKPCRCQNNQDQSMCDFYACGRCNGKEIDKAESSLPEERKIVYKEEREGLTINTLAEIKPQEGEPSLFTIEELKTAFNAGRYVSDFDAWLKDGFNNALVKEREQQAPEITDDDILKAADEYLVKVGNVNRMDIIRHDFIQGILWCRNRLGERKA